MGEDIPKDIYWTVVAPLLSFEYIKSIFLLHLKFLQYFKNESERASYGQYAGFSLWSVSNKLHLNEEK